MKQADVSSGEQAPLLKSSGASSFQLQDDAEVIQVVPLNSSGGRKKLSRKISFENPLFHNRNSSQGSWLSLFALSELSSSGGPSLFRVNIRRLLPRRSRKFRFILMLLICYLGVFIWTAMILLGPTILSLIEKDTWCNLEEGGEGRMLKISGDGGAGRFKNDLDVDEKHYENPDYDMDPCRYTRVPWLLWLTLEECDFCQRMLMSVLLGGAIGYERRSSDRPAGIRTMGLVSLGACFFTISSISGFKSSTMGWDASRVTAALPSGVGFLGASLIWKGTVNIDSQEMQQVHGLTTAASVWLSAAIGVGAGGALYFVSIYSTILILLVLRFGPKLYLQEDSQDEDEEEEELPQPVVEMNEHHQQPEPTQMYTELGEESLVRVDFGDDPDGGDQERDQELDYEREQHERERHFRHSLRIKRHVPTFHG